MFTYFVSYSYTDTTGFGFGSVVIQRHTKVDAQNLPEVLEAWKAGINTQFRNNNVVILSFQLVPAE